MQDIPSVRLYAPPGGTSSISFGGDAPAAPAPVQAAPVPQQQYLAPPVQAAAPVQAAPVQQQQPYGLGAPQGGLGSTASRAPCQGGSQNVGNSIGVSVCSPSVRHCVDFYERLRQNTASAWWISGSHRVLFFLSLIFLSRQDTPSVKLHAPPGGRSQISFG